MSAWLLNESSSVFRNDYEVRPRFSFFPRLRRTGARKIAVIIGLDQILIHASSTRRPYSDFLIALPSGGESVIYSVYTRPFVHEFLSTLAEFATIYLFTTAETEFAQAAIRHLDPSNRLFAGVFTRKDCAQIGPSRFVKNFERCGCDMRRAVIVGHAEEEFGKFAEQGVVIRPFAGEENDAELSALSSRLSAMASRL
jgi:TFIIF-interacting CTD phosphatase-like protein